MRHIHGKEATHAAISATELLVVPRCLSVESNTPEWVVVLDGDTGRRLKLRRGVYDVMSRFVTPTVLAEAIGGGEDGSVMVCQQLVAHGFLRKVVDGVGASDRPSPGELSPVSPTMFRAPLTSHRPGAVRIVGVPYDGGDVKCGARLGPDLVRRRSWDQEYRLDFSSSRPMGWLEVETGERVLEGITVSDEGNVRVNPGEDPARLWERLRELATRILDERGLPFFIGGDHSISFAPIDAVQRRMPCVVVWFDAHTDCGPLPPGYYHSHKNVLRRVIELPNVVKAVVAGHRGYTISDKVVNAPPKLRIVTAEQLIAGGPAAVMKELPEELACYVSIDIDVLDPLHAPATATPSPEGLTPRQLRDILRCIGDARRIVAADFVDLNPLVDDGPLSPAHARRTMTVCLAAATKHHHLQAEMAGAAVAVSGRP